MEIMDAIKVMALMKERDRMIDMHQDCQLNPQAEWSLMINDKRYAIPARVKKFFSEAVAKAVEYLESEIEKI